MIAELGTILLFLALLVALLQAVAGVTYQRSSLAYRLVPACALTGGALAVGAFILLIVAFATSDFGVALVALHSHTQSPNLYKITAAWGNHEGSMLLWCMILSLYGVLMTCYMRGFSPLVRLQSVQVMGMVQSCFLSYVLFTSNPFLPSVFPVMEGEGFNPLLQDIGLAIHPPLLYLGYVGLVVPWAIGVALLRTGEMPAQMAKLLHGWILFPWATLTAGITLGSWWAYRELGWGGWWFWDPVENAALLPWLTATALFHANITLKKKETGERWVIWLALCSFGLSVLGTFLVRSGLLSSVHSFASDPTRGLAICGMMGALLSYALYVYMRYAPFLKATPSRGMVLWSREMLVLLNNIALLLVMSMLLLATFYPFVWEAYSGQRITIGAQYFNAMFRVFTVPMVALCALSYAMAWDAPLQPKKIQQMLVHMLLAALLTGGIALWWHITSLWSMAGLWVGLWLASVTLQLAFTTCRKGKHSRRVLPVLLGHGGLALFVLAVTCYGTFHRSYEFVMQQGEERALEEGMTLRLAEVTFGKEQNYLWQRAKVELQDKERHLALYPEERFYMVEQQFSAETAIHSFFMYDYYVTVRRASDGKQPQTGQAPLASATAMQHYVVEFYSNPAMLWVWSSCVMMVAAGLLAVMMNNKKDKK